MSQNVHESFAMPNSTKSSYGPMDFILTSTVFEVVSHSSPYERRPNTVFSYQPNATASSTVLTTVKSFSSLFSLEFGLDKFYKLVESKLSNHTLLNKKTFGDMYNKLDPIYPFIGRKTEHVVSPV